MSHLDNAPDILIKIVMGKTEVGDGYSGKLVEMADIENYAEEKRKKKIRLSKNGNVIQETTKEAWKLFERNVAKDFGTTRTPLSGSVKTITNSDTLHKKIYIECKYRNDEYTFWEKFEETREKYPNDIIVLCIAVKNRALVHLYYSPDFFKRIETGCGIRLMINNRNSGVCTLFEQTIERSLLEDKLPVVALKKKNGIGYLIGIDPVNFTELQKILTK